MSSLPDDDFIAALAAECAARTPEPWFVYVIYGLRRQVMYVGCTKNLDRRMANHKRKIWYREVCYIRVYDHPDEATALAAEKATIKDLCPLFNVLHNPYPPSEHTRNLYKMLDPHPARRGAIRSAA